MKRRDLIVYLNVRNCNPNGDFETDNAPRQDLMTGLGQMSSQCNKRRIKSAVAQMYDVPMLVDPSLVSIEAKAKKAIAGIDEKELAEMSPFERDKAVKMAICKKYWDVRTFGAAIAGLSKKENNAISDGQITGVVQLSWAESLEPIVVDTPKTISRCNAATDADLKKGKTHDVGNTWIVPFAQYVYEIHVAGAKSTWTGFDEKDYEMLLEGVKKSWLLNQTASKTGMEVDCIVEFTHDSEYGNASPAALRDCITLTKTEEFAGRTKYEVSVDEKKVPKGVTCKIYR